MAPSKRLTDIVAFAQRFTAAQAALAIAALGEPNDDAYLALEHAAQAFFSSDSGLVPLESRWAVPGGVTPHATIDVRESVGPGAVFAVAAVGPDASAGWVAFLAELRDREGRRAASAVLVEEVDGELYVTGRAQWDPFQKPPTWAQAGGKAVPTAGPFGAALVEVVPSDPDSASFIETLGAS